MVKVKIEGISSFVFCNEDYIPVDGIYTIDRDKFQLMSRHLNFAFEIVPTVVFEDESEEVSETVELAETTEQTEVEGVEIKETTKQKVEAKPKKVLYVKAKK